MPGAMAARLPGKMEATNRKLLNGKLPAQDFDKLSPGCHLLKFLQLFPFFKMDLTICV